MSIGKSVPNLISYHHECFQNFSQSPAIYFEQISFRVNFNSEIADKWVRPVSRRTPRRARAAARRCRVAATRRRCDLKPLSGLGVATAVSPAPPRSRAAFRQLTSRPRASSHPPVPRPPHPDSRRPDRRCPSRVARTAAGRVTRRRRAAVSTPMRRRPAVSRAPVPSRRRLVGQRAPLGRAAACTVRAQAAPCGRSPAWPRATHMLCAWAAPALCVWAEREFAQCTRLILLISD
jgi:hypothetical protein